MWAWRPPFRCSSCTVATKLIKRVFMVTVTSLTQSTLTLRTGVQTSLLKHAPECTGRRQQNLIGLFILQFSEEPAPIFWTVEVPACPFAESLGSGTQFLGTHRRSSGTRKDLPYQLAVTVVVDANLLRMLQLLLLSFRVQLASS